MYTKKLIGLIFVILYLFPFNGFTQKIPDKLTISGTAGVSYENYGLMLNPLGGSFYSPRRPWNILRFNIKPIVDIGKLKIPFNLSFIPKQPEYPKLPPVPGLPVPDQQQSLGQYFTNPRNSFSVNPKYKWAELQLGSQYLKYSDLSTGDICVFGYGFNIHPGKYRLRFFKGTSQQAVNFNLAQPAYQGAYQRKIIMAQIGLEKENVYFTGFNILKGNDLIQSVNTSLPNNILPQENVIVSFLTRINAKNGWQMETELGQSFFTRDKQLTGNNIFIKDFEPFIKTNISTHKDNAVQLAVSKKKSNWEIGVSGKWLGAGYLTMGYPFLQNDRLEYSVNTKFNLWKSKMNFLANIGQRFGNWSKIAGGERNKQLLANANLNTQFNEHFNVNIGFNNFGFYAPSNLPAGGIKNVGSDFNINPTYTFQGKKIMHMASASYNWSKYDEMVFPNGVPVITANNTQTYLVLYAPTWIESPVSGDLSFMYFKNKGQQNLQIRSLSNGFHYNLKKKKLILNSQVLYNATYLQPYTKSRNLLVTIGFDKIIAAGLTWKFSFTSNFYKFGNEFFPQYLDPSYIESLLRTSIQYKFKKKTIRLKNKL